jgi:hemoglobin/transferrin/lactoferrin receptor protein
VPTTFQSINIGRVKISGLEAKLSWRLDDVVKGLTFIASVGQTKGDNLVANTPLDSVDPRKTVMGLKYDAPSRLFGVEGLLTNAAAKTRVSSPTFFQPASSNVVDVLAYWRPLPQLQFNVGVFNLSDKKYWQWSDVRGIAAISLVLDRFTQPGRNVSLSAKYVF